MNGMSEFQVPRIASRKVILATTSRSRGDAATRGDTSSRENSFVDRGSQGEHGDVYQRSDKLSKNKFF